MNSLARVESPHTVRAPRVTLRPVEPEHLPHLEALKSDEQAFGLMLGGVRPVARVAAELQADMAYWREHGHGIWAVHRSEDEAFLGIVGLEDRPDGRGIALRFALWPHVRGKGYAREAAQAALRFGHEQAGLPRIVAVARVSNLASRAVLTDLGMRVAEAFVQNGHDMLLFESLAS